MLPKPKDVTRGNVLRALFQAFPSLRLDEGSQQWYKLHRPRGSCVIYDTLGTTRLRLVTPRVIYIHHSFLGVYLSLACAPGLENLNNPASHLKWPAN